MKLQSVHVTEFQSVRDTNPFKVGDITCLVGKNEAGKTAILQALYRLNPIIPEHGHYDVTDDYPRVDVEDYRHAVESGQREPAVVVETVFALENEDLQHITDSFGKGLLKRPELILKKGYEGNLYVDLPVEEKVAVAAFVGEAQLPDELAKILLNRTSLDDLCETINDLQTEDNAEHIKRLSTIVEQVKKEGGLTLYVYKKYLSSRVPKFLYFDEYYQMTGHENIEALIERQKKNELKISDYPLLGLRTYQEFCV